MLDIRLPTGLPALALAAAILGAALPASAIAQDRPFWDRSDSYGEQRPPATARAPRRDDAYRPPQGYDGPPGGFGQQAAPDGTPYEGGAYASPQPPYAGAPPPYGRPGGYEQQPPAYGAPAYQPPGYDQRPGYGAPIPEQRQADSWRQPPAQARPYGNDTYQPPVPQAGWNDGRQQGYGPPTGYQADRGGYGQPYAPPPDQDGPPPASPGYYGAPGQPPNGRAAYDDPRWDERRGPSSYSQNEVVDTGHRFFGSISQGLARAIEHAFKSQGRPNGYILGEDAGGAFVAGLRYGEGMLYTKDVGNHRVFWQGPSLGYDFGGEGSKTMVLVYKLRDPSDIYHRFGGVQGSVYVIGGVSVQFQTHEHVTLAVIRSGVGLRVGANVGYLKYTRAPTWNPF